MSSKSHYLRHTRLALSRTDRLATCIEVIRLHEVFERAIPLINRALTQPPGAQGHSVSSAAPPAREGAPMNGQKFLFNIPILYTGAASLIAVLAFVCVTQA